jgi:polygalacturonase
MKQKINISPVKSALALLNFHFVAMLIVYIMCAPVAIKAQPAYFKDIPYEIAPINAPFDMPQLTRPVFPDKTFNILEFGAKMMNGAEKTKCTDAIHQAIKAANKSGGGKVVIPKGEWLTGPIHLMSHVNLHIEEGATVFFSEDKEDYLPVVIQRHEGVEAYNYSPLIYAFELRNVALTGKGILDGQGKHWWDFRQTQPRAIATQIPLSKRDFGKGAGREGMRPNFIVFWKSENILVEDITILDGPMWNVHLVYCKKAIVRGITVNSLKAANGDGIVIDSSRDVLVEYNHLMTGDDAVVIKSGYNEEGLEINIPTENLVVRNFYAYDVRTGSGGVVFGSETSGGLRNIYVHDGFFEECDRGIRFKTGRGRGNTVENIYVRDIHLKNTRIEAINFNTFYTGARSVGPSPSIRNIDIRNIKIDGVPKAIVLTGLPERWLENIHLENIEIVNAKEGVRLTRVKTITMNNIKVMSETRAMIAEDVYELTLQNVTLAQEEKSSPLLLQGQHTGAIFTTDFPLSSIEFSEGLSNQIIFEKAAVRTW